MADSNSNSGPIDPAASNSPSPIPPKRKKRLALKIIGAVLLVVILLIALAPTLIGSRPVLSIILGKVNDKLNGHVEIESLSLGWFSGVDVKGVRVFDADKSQIAEVDHLTVPLPLVKVLMGKYALGNVLVDGLSADVKFDEKHQSNFAQLLSKPTIAPPASPSAPSPPAPASPATPPPAPETASASKPSKLPAISGNIRLTHSHLTIAAPKSPTTYVDALEGEIKIPDINSPVSDTLSMNIRSGNGTPGSVNASGTAAAIANNEIAIEVAQVHQKLSITGLDLQSLRPFKAAQTPDDNLVGLLTADADLDYADSALNQKLSITLDRSKGQPVNGKLPAITHLDQSISLVYKDSSGAIPDLRDIDLKIASKSINGQFKGKTLAELNGSVNADLSAATAEFGALLADNLHLEGNLVINIGSQGKLGDSRLGVNIAGQNLKYASAGGSAVEEPNLQLNLGVSLIGDENNPAKSAKDLALMLKTGAPDAPTIDLLAEAKQLDWHDGLAADFHLTHLVADLPRLQQQFAPVKPNTAGAIIDQGTLIVTANGLAKGDDKTLDALSVTVDRLKVSQQTADGKRSPGSDGGSVHLTGSASTDGSNIALKLAGKVAELTQAYTAYSGKPAGAYPYRGDLSLTQNITMAAGDTKLKGTLDIAGFQTMNGTAVTFSDDHFAIGNDVVLTKAGEDESITIHSLTAETQSTHALKLALQNGTIQHVPTSRDMNLKPTLDYDLAKVWPIVQPIMGDKYKTLKITGQFSKVFTITGSYPADQPSTVAIKTLHADGDLAVASFDYNGLNLQNFIVPFTLDNGQLRTVYAGKPEGQNLAPAAVANGGTLDLSNLTIDLTQSPPRLTTPANKVLLAHVTINPLFADSYLAKFLNNPIFVGTKDATGLFDLTIVACNALPLGDLVTQSDPTNTGRADLKFSLTNLTISSPLTSEMLSFLKQAKFDANVKDGTVSVAKGISTEHMAFSTGPYSLGFDGDVRLSDERFMPLNVSVGPINVMVQRSGVHDQNVLKYVPERATLPIEGTMKDFKINGGSFLQKIITDASTKAVTNGLLGGDKNGKSPLDGLLKKLK